MDSKTIIIFALSFSFFIIGMINYHPQSQINTFKYCSNVSSTSNLCILCPEKSESFKRSKFISITSNNQFYVMMVGSPYDVKQEKCGNYLKFISYTEPQASKQKNQTIQNIQYLIEKKIIRIQKSIEEKFIPSQSKIQSKTNIQQIKQHKLTIQNDEQFIIFYKKESFFSSEYPLARIENQDNLKTIQFYGKVLSWSMLFSFVLHFLMRKFGIFISNKQVKINMTILIINLFCMYFINENKFIEHLNVFEIMFFTLAYLNFSNQKHRIITLAISIALMTLKREFILVSYLFFCFKFLSSTSLKKFESILNGFLIAVLMISTLLSFGQYIFQHNVSVYISYLFKIIFLNSAMFMIRLKEGQKIK